MSDPHDLDSVPEGGRLVDEGADDFERALLRSAKRDRMRSDQKRILAAAIGVGTGGATLLGATKAAAAAKSGAKLGTLALVKWLGIGLATVAATAGTARLVVEHQGREAPRPATVVAAGTAPVAGPPIAGPSPLAVAPPEPQAAEPVPSASVEPQGALARREAPPPSDRPTAPSAPDLAPEAPSAPPPLAVVVPEPSVPAPMATGTPRPPATRLDEQLALIGKARAALETNDAAAAMRTLDSYGAQFPQGALGEEAELLRVRATAQAGDRTGARRLAEAFLIRHPASPYAARVRSIAEAP